MSGDLMDPFTAALIALPVCLALVARWLVKGSAW